MVRAKWRQRGEILSRFALLLACVAASGSTALGLPSVTAAETINWRDESMAWRDETMAWREMAFHGAPRCTLAPGPSQLTIAEAHAAEAHATEAHATGAHAAEATTPKAAYQVGSLVVTRLWSRPTFGAARLTAGYLRIANTGTEPDRLIGGFTAIAGELEIHASEVTDGVSRMRPLREGVEIPAGDTIELGPGGKHLMFARLTAPVAQGESFAATLVFEKAGSVVVEFAVRSHPDTDDAEPAP